MSRKPLRSRRKQETGRVFGPVVTEHSSGARLAGSDPAWPRPSRATSRQRSLNPVLGLAGVRTARLGGLLGPAHRARVPGCCVRALSAGVRDYCYSRALGTTETTTTKSSSGGASQTRCLTPTRSVHPATVPPR